MFKKNHWIDVHTHLHMLSTPSDQIIKEAQIKEINKIITVGTSAKDWNQVIDDVRKFSIYGAIGCHPHESQHYNDKDEEKLKKGLKTQGIIALGEIGLDYYYQHSDRKIQQTVFRKQMETAKQMKLPVEIHTREAEKETIEILSEYKNHVQGLIHCFTGSLNMAKKALDIGYNISFSGIITFKNASNLRDVCSKIPLDRIHIETDAPYLAPVPYRGKENQPAWLIHTAQIICEIHCISMDTLKKQTWINACHLFPRISHDS